MLSIILLLLCHMTLWFLCASSYSPPVWRMGYIPASSNPPGFQTSGLYPERRVRAPTTPQIFLLVLLLTSTDARECVCKTYIIIVFHPISGYIETHLSDGKTATMFVGDKSLIERSRTARTSTRKKLARYK